MSPGGDFAFIDQEPATLDRTGRVRIPTRYRKLLGRDVVLGPRDGAIAIWPQAGFPPVVHAMREKEPRSYQRWFASKAATSQVVDGELAPPQRLLNWAEIESKLMIAGAIECLELWSLQRWAQIDTRTPPEGPYIV